MKAYIDQNCCIFCGMCGGVCPEVFRVDPNRRKSMALDIELTGALLKNAKYAETLCPVKAIKIKDITEKDK